MTPSPTASTTAAEFVAQDARSRVRVKPFHEMQIAVAQPGKGGAQQHLASLRLFQRDFLDR